MKILDMECAGVGNEIADKVFEIFRDKNKTETLITKSLGVLQEDGIYASLLYLESQGKENPDGTKTPEKQAAEAIRKLNYRLLQQNIPEGLLAEEKNALAEIRNKLSNNLDALFLAKELLERTLVYARYHAKALGSNSNEDGA
ncbi:hypothetical protein [uncultured Candidatus Kuenenia sp.]|uniref:hypothetical protein n=1 Tax=uncultured Candidatus Kuenenia sp. TaxID=1048336 RepID=UPI0002FF9B8C|nr:hypothetical protein [uncultured Candidatus Kuenenia sp.]